MPNIFHQSIEDILKTATPEQKLLWNYVFLRWGERVAISQFVFSGDISTSEMYVYKAGTIYLAYQLNFTFSPTIGIPVSAAQLYFMNENNVLDFILANHNIFWDATAAEARCTANSVVMNNFYFSRAIRYGTGNVKFIGYRITF